MKTVKRITLTFTMVLDDGKDADARALNELAFVFLSGNAEVAEFLHNIAEHSAKEANVTLDNLDSRVQEWSITSWDVKDEAMLRAAGVAQGIDAAHRGSTPIKLDRQDWATVRAALQHYLDHSLGEPSKRSDEVHDLATDNDRTISLDNDAIDALLQRMKEAAE